MKSRRLGLFEWTAIAWLGLLILAALVSCSFWRSEPAHRSDTPLSYAEASSRGVQNLGPGAKNVYFLYFADWQIFHSYTRFDVPLNDLDQMLDSIIKKQNAKLKISPNYQHKPLDSSSPHIMPHPEYLPMNWWDTKAIGRGYYLGDPSNSPLSLQIWVDEGRGRVYIYQYQ